MSKEYKSVVGGYEIAVTLTENIEDPFIILWEENLYKVIRGHAFVVPCSTDVPLKPRMPCFVETEETPGTGKEEAPHVYECHKCGMFFSDPITYNSVCAHCDGGVLEERRKTPLHTRINKLEDSMAKLTTENMRLQGIIVDFEKVNTALRQDLEDSEARREELGSMLADIKSSVEGF